MSNTIYESGTIDGLSGFDIEHERNSIYGIHITDPSWGAVTPETLREAADAIERHRDGVAVEFEDQGGESYRVKIDQRGNFTIEGVGGATSVVWLSKSQIGELIQRVINAKKASSV